MIKVKKDYVLIREHKGYLPSQGAAWVGTKPHVKRRIFTNTHTKQRWFLRNRKRIFLDGIKYETKSRIIKMIEEKRKTKRG